MPDDVLLNKCEIVERCLKRIQEDYEGYESELSDDFMRQDAILLNIQRMCETSIDLEIVHAIINQHLNDFRALTRWAIRHDKQDQDG